MHEQALTGTLTISGVLVFTDKDGNVVEEKPFETVQPVEIPPQETEEVKQ